MANKIDCIQVVKAAAGELITDDEAQTLLGRIKKASEARAYKKAINREQAIKEIAGEILHDHALGKKQAERQALMNFQKQKSIEAAARKSKVWGEGLERLLGETGAKALGVELKYQGRFLAALRKAELDGAFFHMDDEMERMVAVELEQLGEGGKPGVSGSVKAQQIAGIIREIREPINARLNRAGAFIKDSVDYIFRQSHDADRIRKLGKTKQESYIKWRDTILPLLDVDATFKGRDIEKTLRYIHDNFYSKDFGKLNADDMVDVFPLKSSLAKRMSMDRFFQFKDAESFLAYNRKLGKSNMAVSIMEELRHKAKATVIMEELGPNFRENFNGVRQRLADEAKHNNDPKFESLKQSESLGSGPDGPWKMRTMLSDLAGDLSNPENTSIQRAGMLFRSQQFGSKLGGASISALGDRLVFHPSTLAWNGVRAVDILLENFRQLFPKSEDMKQFLMLAGAGFEGVSGDLSSRFGMQYEGARSIGHSMASGIMKWSGLNLVTNAAKSGTMRTLMANLGFHAHLSADALPPAFHRIFEKYHITKLEWDVMRQHATEEFGSKSIFPDLAERISEGDLNRLVDEAGLKQTPANRARARDAIETKFRHYLTDQVDTANPTPGLEDRVYLHGGTQAGTKFGEAVRLFTMLKSYPVTVMRRIVARDAMGRGWASEAWKGNFWMGANLALSTLAGYMIIAASEARQGKMPRPLTNQDGSFNWKTINDSLVRGGSMGIMGDVLFNEYDSTYRTFTGMLAGPALGTVSQIMALKGEAMSGKDVKAEAIRLGEANVPFLNLFYVKPIMDTMWLWHLKEMASPGYLRRVEQRAKDTYNQDYIIKPSEIVNR